MRGVSGRPVAPPRPLHLGIGKKEIGVRGLTLWLACVLSLLADSASPHDASSYGGVFRSRRSRRRLVECGCRPVSQCGACHCGRSTQFVSPAGRHRSRNPEFAQWGTELGAGSPRRHYRRGICARVFAGRPAGRVRGSKRRVSSRAGRLAARRGPGVRVPGAGAGRRASERSFLSARPEPAVCKRGRRPHLCGRARELRG